MRRTTKRNDNRNRRNISKNDRYDLLTVRKRGELPVGGGAGSPATHSKHRAWLIVGIVLAAVLVLGIWYLAGRQGTIAGEAIAKGKAEPKIPQCTGTLPQHSQFCDGDDIVTKNTKIALVSTCTTAKKCEATCNEGEGFQRAGSTCIQIQPVEHQCTGTLTIATIELCPGDDTDLTTSTPRTFVSECGSNKCEYVCIAGYVKSSTTQSCQLAPCSSPSAGLITWWKGELQNKVAIDTAGSIHDGAVGMENPALSVSGRVGSALDISPQNGNYLGVAHSSDLALTTQLTIEGWIKSRTQKNAQLVRKWVDNKGYNLVMTSTGKIKLYINNRAIESTAIIPTGEFIHIAVVYDGPKELLRTYINGQAGPGATIIPASITANTESLYIGGGVTGQVFDGLIDELSIYNRALSAAEIKGISDAGSAGKCREICSTNGDDDGDGLVNCADPDCAGQAADQAGHLCETPESSCSDSFDNDGDTYMDFMDLTNCNKGQSCTKGDDSPGTIVWSYFLPAHQSQYTAGTPPPITQIGCCGATQCVTESGNPSNPILCLNKDQLIADPAFVCGDNNNIVQCNAAAQGTVTSTSTNKNLCDNNQWKTCDASRNNAVIGNQKCLAGIWGLFTQQCGNNVKEGTEACDGTALAGQTCVTQMGTGFTGTLTCKTDCSGFVTTGCAAPVYQCVNQFNYDLTNAILCSGDDTGLSANANINLVTGCSNNIKCEYICGQGYTKSGSSCVLAAPTGQCTGQFPSQATATLCTDDNTGLTADVTNIAVTDCTTGRKCEYQCRADLDYAPKVSDPTTCVKCTGAVPANADLCLNDESSVTTVTPRAVVAACGSAKCEFTCKDGFTKSGNSCVSASVTPTVDLSETPGCGNTVCNSYENPCTCSQDCSGACESSLQTTDTDNDGITDAQDYCPGTDQASTNYPGLTFELGYIAANGCPQGDMAGNTDGQNHPRPDGCFNNLDTDYIYALFDPVCTSGTYGIDTGATAGEDADADGVNNEKDYCPGTDQASTNYPGLTFELGYIAANGCPQGDMAGNTDEQNHPRPDGCFNNLDTDYIYALFDPLCTSITTS